MLGVIDSRPGNLFSQVHDIETSASPPIPPTFRELCLQGSEAEYEATHQAYQVIDDLTGTDQVSKLKVCKTRAFFSVNLENRSVRVASNNCRLRWCPICSRGLSVMREATVTEWLNEQPFVRFLTLTVKHTDDDLSAQITRLYLWFRKLRMTSFFKGYCTGGIWFFQIKRSHITQEWHPHLHCVITGSRIPHAELCDKWLEITGTSTVVDIRGISDKNEVGKYIARYSSRPACLCQYTEIDRNEIINALHGKRLCGTWGTGRSCSLSRMTTIDTSRWRNVGKFSTVVKHTDLHQFAKIIYKCWVTNRPLPDDIDLSILDKIPPELSIFDLPELTYLESVRFL